MTCISLMLSLLLLPSITGMDDPDAQEWVGSYQIVGGSRGTERLDANKYQGVVVRIAANAITTYDTQNKEIYAATYELDRKSNPWRIVMTATITPVDGKDGGKGEGGIGSKAMGLMHHEGDIVKLIYALPGGEPPRSFDAKEKQQLFILKKISKK